MDDMKRYSKYDNEKELSEFNFRKDIQKYRTECIQCCSFKHKQWRDSNPDKVKQNQKKCNGENKEKKHISQKQARNRC